MIYDQVGFNEEWVLKYDETAFVNHPANQHLWKGISSEDRALKLKEVHQLITYAYNKQLDASEPEGGYTD